MKTVNLYEAKTHLSALVDAAAAGEEIVIAKNGVAKAKLVPVPDVVAKRVPTGTLGVTHMADDFDDPDPEIIAMFEGGGPDGVTDSDEAAA